MKRRPFRQGFAFALGLLVALGLSLSAVHASGVAVHMAAATDMSAEGSGGCGGGCNDAGGSTGTAMICSAVCVAPVVAVLSPALSVTFGHAAHVQFGPDSLLRDWASSPDPYPPRPRDLG
jgi:hypothetical protein